MNWRTKKKCSNCPFAKSGPGLFLRKGLETMRWHGILVNLRRGGHFHCHKTTNETGDGSNLLCAGSLEWQKKNIGQVGDLAQVMERLEKIHARKTKNVSRR